MGIDPAPTMYNNACPLCFPANSTPDQMKCFVSGVMKSPHFPGEIRPAPNGYCDILQVGPGCNWSGGSEVIWRSQLSYTAVDSQISVEVALGVDAFVASPALLCQTHFTNEHLDPNIFAFYGGWAVVTTPMKMEEYINKITELVGPEPKMELFAMANKYHVVKFCNTQDGTNIKIRMKTPSW